MCCLKLLENVVQNRNLHICMAFKNRFKPQKIPLLKGLSHEIDFQNFDKNLHNLA